MKKKRIVAFLNTAEFKIPTHKEVDVLNSKCIQVIGYHKPDLLVLETFCPNTKVGVEIDLWASKLKK